VLPIEYGMEELFDLLAHDIPVTKNLESGDPELFSDITRPELEFTLR
tara:strand:- start:640 stop:780 length:141 start_codon:yes stop_codon:yes gene_type:complete